MNTKTDLQKNNRNKIIGDCLLITMVVAVIIYTIRSFIDSSMDSDAFFLINTGKYIVENKLVPTINPFVIHEGFEIIVQQWLFDVVLYGVYNAFGLYGMYLYRVVILFLTLFVLNKFISLYTANIDIKVFCLSVYCVLWSFFLTTRPTSISFIMCLCLIMTIENYRRTNKPLKLLYLLPISLVVVNTHAALWPMLFVLMLPYIAPEFAIKFLWDAFSAQMSEKTRPEKLETGHMKNEAKAWIGCKKHMLLAMLGMFIVGFANPNGIKGMFYVVLSYGSASSGNVILELQAPTITSVFGAISVAAIIALILYVQTYKDKVDIPLVYMSLGTIILSIMHIRNSWFLCFSLLPIVAKLLTDAIAKTNSVSNEKRKLHKIPCVIAAVALITTVVIAQPNKLTDSEISPIKAGEYLNAYDKDDIVLFTEFNNGAFMSFHGYKIYMEARPELFQKKVNGKDDVYEEYWDVKKGECDIAEFVNKYQFTHMIVEDGSALSGYMQATTDYVAVVESDSYKLYESVKFTSN